VDRLQQQKVRQSYSYDWLSICHGIWRGGVTVPCIHNLHIRWRGSQHHTLGKENLVTNDRRSNGSYNQAGQCGEEKKSLAPAGNQIWFLDHPACSQLLYWLSCIGSCNNKAINEICGNISVSLLSTHRTDYTAVTAAQISPEMWQTFCKNWNTKPDRKDSNRSSLVTCHWNQRVSHTYQTQWKDKILTFLATTPPLLFTFT
jgi:hypothetical protein